MNTKIEQLREYAKIIKDTPYALKTYLQTYDNTQKKFVPLDLFPDQITLINDYETHNENITRKYRQAGVSTVTAAWLSKLLQTAKPENPHKVLVVANKRDTAIELSNKIKDFLRQWPDWMNVGFDPDKNSESRYKLNNGCEVKAVATSKDALRGYTPTILIFDEAAHIEAGEDFWAASMASLSTGGKVILISTPNGHDPIYYPIYDQSIRGENNFHITDLRWYKDNRYAKDIKWLKINDMVHYMLNRELYNDDEITLDREVIDDYDEVIEQGYKPYSPWYETMSRKLKWDKRKIAQEIECDFLGSGDDVIPQEVKSNIAKNMIRVPKEKYISGTLWQWKEPIEGHKYIMGCLPPEEMVLTNDGLISIEDVDERHKLIDENGLYVNIINKQKYDVIDEDVYEIGLDNTFRTTKFTKEHPILCSRDTLKRNYKKNDVNYRFNERYWDFDFNYIKAENLSIGNWIKVPNIYKKELNFDVNEKWIPNNENVRKDFLINSPLSNKDFWWFMGLWLGDGWIEKNKYSHSIVICFNKKEYCYTEKCIDIVKKIFNRSPLIRERQSTIELRFNSKELYLFILENFGQYSYGKKITEWVKFIPIEYKKEIVRGYFDSDGCWLKTLQRNKINSKISFVSINLELLEGIQDILFSLGVISSLNLLRESSENLICGKPSKTKKTFNLNLSNYDSLELIKLIYDIDDIKLNKFDINEFSNINNRVVSSCHFNKTKDFIYFRIKKINKTKLTGTVYNFETDTHTFMCHHITTHNCDVSRGDSEDFSSINIIDFDDREQVLEYIGKIPPDNLAEIAYRWGTLYKCFIGIDITGGMGIATSRKLQEMNYKDLFIDGVNVKDIWTYNPKALEKIPGINFNNKRTQIVATFEEQLRNGFIIRSERLLSELNTFVYLNGRPDHMKGSHDDAIMSMAIALYIGEISFNQLQRVESQNKAMIESWTVNERTYEPNKSFYSYGTTFDPVGFMQTDPTRSYYNQQINPMNIPKDAYKEYSWLFGKRR